MSLVIFYILGAAILIAALLVVTLRNIFHSALFLVATFFLVAGIYLMLNAEFLAAAQVLIYVGAVTILILFAIMLTHRIQSKSIRQVNEQVLPAIIIAGLLLVISIFTINQTFRDSSPTSKNRGCWTATFDTDKIRDHIGLWEWAARIEDDSGKDYYAFGSFTVLNENTPSGTGKKTSVEPGIGNGYIISSNPGFTTSGAVFSRGQNIYFKMWSDAVDYSSMAVAEWYLFKADKNRPYADPWSLIGSLGDEKIIIQLSNSNSESIGRLLMSTFVLPFEIVSVLLLAALIGAIVIARKDD